MLPWKHRITLGANSSSSGSTYTSSSSANFSISVNRLSLKICLASNGWLWSDTKARLASSTLRSSTKMKLFRNRRWENVAGKKVFGLHTHPLLLPVESSHGTWMSSGLIVTPFLENSLQIFANNFSSLSFPMMGTPSTRSTLSKLSSYWILYLADSEYVDLQVAFEFTCFRYQSSQCLLDLVGVLRTWWTFTNFTEHFFIRWFAQCMYLLSYTLEGEPSLVKSHCLAECNLADLGRFIASWTTAQWKSDEQSISRLARTTYG